MKNLLLRSCRRITAGKIVFTLALTFLLGLSSKAQDVVYVSSYTGSSVSSFPPYGFVSGTSYSAFGSTAIASPTGAPSRTKTVYGYSTDCIWKLQPTLAVAGAVYKIETAHTASTTSSNVLMTLYSSDGDVSASCTNTSAFDAAHGGNSWQTIGYITNHAGVTQPTIFFAVSGGAAGPSSSANRVYFDVFRFTEQGNPCSGVAGDVFVAGPLAANQTFVNVTSVDAAASTVTVYADGNVIGTLSSPSIVAGNNSVPVTALVTGNQIKATQTKGSCTSSMPSSGPIVGSGANVQINAFLSCYSNATFAGPVGANTTAGLVNNYILEASGLTFGSQSAPLGGFPLAPSQCWQTLTFNQTDPSIYPNNGFSAAGNNDPYCALDALVFAINPAALDSGPYDIYVDRIMNGDVVIEDFESYGVGTTNTFIAPNAATTPSPASTFLSGINSSLVSTNQAFDGTKSCRIRFQFADASDVRWTRVVAGATTGKRNPQLDMTKPVTIRYLVLPIGETTNKMHFPTVPVSRQTLLTNSTVTWTVSPVGEGTFSYQWKYEGGPITDATTSSFTKSNVQLADAGTYSVDVTGDSTGCTATHTALLTVVESKPVIGYSVVTTNINLNWTATNFTLQSAASLSGPWTDVSSSTNVQQVIAKTNRFFRLRP